MFRQAIIAGTSISTGLCCVLWAEQALLALHVGVGEQELGRRAAFWVWAVAAGLQKGRHHPLLWMSEKKQLLLSRSCCPLESMERQWGAKCH